MARQARDHLDFLRSLEEQILKCHQLEEKVLKLEFEDKELRSLRSRLLAALEHKCDLLSQMNGVINRGLRERVTMLKASFHSTFKQAVGVEVELRLRQMKELTTLNGNVDVAEIQDRAAHTPNYRNVVDNMKRMEIELRCGICSELMFYATSLNCMHTFCQYCISQWKHFQRTRETAVGCPVCREPIKLEKRNYFADNLIEIMMDFYPEEEKNNRKELFAYHQEMTQNLFGKRSETNSFSQATNRTGQLIREIEMQVEDIFQFLVERDHTPDAVDALVTPTLRDVPLPQPTIPARLASTLVAAVIPVQRTSASQTSETQTNSNPPRVRGNAQSHRESRPAILGILGPRRIQRTNRTNQSSARQARKPQGTLLARPHWRY